MEKSGQVTEFQKNNEKNLSIMYNCFDNSPFNHTYPG